MIDEKYLQEPWFLLEKLHNYPPVTLEPYMMGMANHLSEVGLNNVPHHVMEYKEGLVKMFFLSDEWNGTAERNFLAIKNNPAILDNLHSESDNILVPQIQILCKEIIESNLSKYSDDELLNLYKKLYELKGRLQLIRAVVWNIETPNEFLSRYLIDFLRQEIINKKLNLDPALVFSILTNPLDGTLVSNEQIDLLFLAAKVRMGGVLLVETDPEIVAHAKKYCFLPFGCEGPAWGAKDIIDRLGELLNSGLEINFEVQAENLKKEFIIRKQKQYDLYEKLQLDNLHKHLISVTQDTVYQKGWSKEHNYLAWYALDRLLRELAKRLFITIQQIRYALPAEIPNMLKTKECDIDELNRRFKYSLLCANKNGSYILSGDEALSLRAKLNIKENLSDVDFNIKEFFGVVAVPGKATGRVKIINKISEMEKMQTGDILVSEMTIPEIVGAMKKASAIVTDMGGITCHAAIVARELGIPCVIGTKIATRILKDGDMVEVDAEKGAIKKIII